jgi:hypothetical protein
MARFLIFAALFFALFACAAPVLRAQTTEFTYQGSLKDGATLANANYDFEFALFDSLSGGSQIGAPIPKNAVVVANGIFAVKLDFGGQFPGTNRYLEIRVKLSGQPAITTLGPRQLINSAPYSVKSLSADSANNATSAGTSGNSLNLGGVPATQYVLTSDGRLSDARNPLPNSASYIQNTASPQASSDFNVSGNGTAGGTLTGDILRANAQFNIGGNRVLSVAGTNNTFAGVNAGASNTGSENSFFGRGAGFNNIDGADNSFFGYQAGNTNTTGSRNSFFGSGAGTNSTADWNTFFGYQAGKLIGSGSQNSFFGSQAGQSAGATVTRSSYFGSFAGQYSAGFDNVYVGDNAGAGAPLTNNSGANNVFVGSRTGATNASGSLNVFVGANAGFWNSTGVGNVVVGYNDTMSETTNSTGSWNTLIGDYATVGSSDLTHATAVGSGTVVTTNNTIVLGRADASDTVDIPGKLQIDTLASAGGTPLCLNGSNRVGTCAAAVLPGNIAELQTRIETQQAKIEAVENQNRSQQKEINQQLQLIRNLTKALCAINPKADVCQQ